MGTENGNGAGPPYKLTPTQQRLYAALSPCVPVRAAELMTLLADDQAGDTALAFHLSTIRRKIRPHGEDVATHIVDRVTYYQLVRLTASPYRD